jgi:hypothetical protein
MEFILKGQELKAKHQFLLMETNEIINMTDAFNIWLYDKDIIFNLDARLAGTYENFTELFANTNVMKFLADNNTTNELIMENTITYQNYTDNMLNIYNKEISSYKIWKREVNRAHIDSDGFTLKQLINSFKPEEEMDKKSKYKEFNRSRKYLTFKLQDILDKPNKVLDVSNITYMGDNVKSILITKTSKEPLKFGSPRLPIVSANISNYEIAISLIKDGKKLYKDDIEYVRRLIDNNQPVLFEYNPEFVINL